MEFKLLNNSMIASLDDKGNWLYKANTENQLKPFKKNGVLRAQYKDLPRFRAIAQYENQEVKDFESLLKESVKDISIKLLSFTK